MFEIHYSRGRSKFDNQPVQCSAKDFDEFADRIAQDISAEKGLAYVCGPMSFGPHDNPKRYDGNAHWRLASHALPRRFLSLDEDGVESPAAYQSMVDFLSPFNALIYTTASHTPDQPRARVIIELSRAVDRDEGIALGAAVQRAVESKLGAGQVKLDDNVYRAEQPIFTPVGSPEIIRHRGAPLDVDGGAIHAPTFLQAPKPKLAIVGATGPLVGSLARLPGAPPTPRAGMVSPAAIALAGKAPFVLPEIMHDGEGRRETLLSYASWLGAKEMEQADIENTLLEYNRKKCIPPVDEATVLDLARRYEKQRAAAKSSGHNAKVSDWPDELNLKYAWIEAQASIFRTEFGDFIDPAKFKTQLDNRQVSVTQGSTTKLVGMGTAWIKNPARRGHRQLVMRPSEMQVTKDNCLNEWRGYAAPAAPGDCKPFLRLLSRLIPARDPRHFVLQWMGHLIQHPGVKMHVSLAFWSHVQGVGKNLLFECLLALIGNVHSTLIGQSELRGSFNGWANRRVFVLGDEISSTDRRQDTDHLKGLVTGSTVYINEKYQPAREVQNLMNFVFLSNHNDALFIGDTDRRYFVWEITGGKLPDTDTKAFVQWRDNGGLSALHYMLLQIDLSAFNPKAAAPMTDAKLQMVQDNRSDLENWLAELMASNISQVVGRELVTANELARRYASHTGHREPSAKTIVGICKKHGAFARTSQVRLVSGDKRRVMALTRTQHWQAQPEADWAAEMALPFKWA